MFTFHHFQRHYQNCTEHINTAIGTAHKTCLRGFGGNGSIAWTSAVSHGGRTSNAFKVTMKLQTFLFQMVVTSCIYVQYLWKYGFAQFFDNLYAPCTCLTYRLFQDLCRHSSVLCVISWRTDLWLCKANIGHSGLKHTMSSTWSLNYCIEFDILFYLSFIIYSVTNLCFAINIKSFQGIHHIAFLLYM